MGLDIRWPIGIMFSIIGVLLIISTAQGATSVSGLSLGININVVWGIILLVFGVFMLIGAMKGKKDESGK